MQRSLDDAIADCENEPIQIPGSIQSHGILITLRSSDFTILQISESVYEVFGIHHSELLHQPLSKLMPIDSVERATKRLGDRVPRLLNPIPLEVTVRGKGKKLDGILHRSGRVLILELEEHIDEDKGYGGFGGFYEAIREVTSKLMVTENLTEVLELGCQELRKLTGFSRVLVYRFDESWNGEVVNESKEDDVESLLHHHFPASDIPKQARELYTTNWLRIIPDANYKPSPIIPAINPITDKPLDLSNSVLRSVSPVHIEYMRNMGQMASMSVSLLNGRKLWGLISCHHPEAHFLKYDVRVACEFIGQMISAQIVAREESSEVDHKLQLKKLYDDLLKTGAGYGGVQKSFAENPSAILGLTDAEGVALCFNNRFVCIGATPSHDELALIRTVISSSTERIVVSDSLEGLNLQPKLTSSNVGGVLAINLRRGEEHDCVIWFRPEERNQTKWAGDPSLAKSMTDDGKIHPRSSFKTWYGQVQGRSKKWLSVEIQAVTELAESLSVLQVSSHKLAGPVDKDEGFRDSLANSIATTVATQSLREIGSRDLLRTSDTDESGKSSKLLLEGFSEFAVLFISSAGVIQNWSAGVKRLLGYTRQQVIGKPISIFFSEDDVLKEKPDLILKQAHEHGRVEEELWLFRADQTSFWAKVMVAPVLNEVGRSIGFSFVVHDVTAQKSAEEELKATKISAEAANLAKTAFLANVSHEIRTPLGAVLGFSELMMADHLTVSEKKDLYARVKRNGDQLTVLINDLLDIGKAESGKIEVENLAIDFNLLLADIEDIFSLKAAEKGVAFRIKLNTELPTYINSDPTRLRQVLINLLGNAIKFTPSGGSVMLLVSLEQMSKTDQVVFRVKDTGRGMTEAEMERLFRPFAQADVSTTRVYGGSGLGLYLSQRLARALGGDLNIEWSERGKGTTFLAQIDPGHIQGLTRFSQVQRNPTKNIFQPLESLDLKGVRILVVDDSKDNRDLLTTYLQKAGANVELAENGQAGVAKALSEAFGLILMDIQMPVVDGNQAMLKLKEAGCKTPVIALTAHAMREERDLSLSLGFVDYLTKPIDRRQLMDRIKSTLQSSAT